jgi:predicted anti-sigma-YlaC factor YlaD
MSDHSNEIVEGECAPGCVNKDIGQLLPDYLVGLLSVSASDEVKEHLLFCRECREHYLKIISLRTAARVQVRAATAAGSSGASGAEVLKITDFLK